jgi:copper(I)-binding protein
MRISSLIAAFCLFLAPAHAYAHSTKSGDIAVGHIWAYPAQNGESTVDVFGPLLNGGDAADALTGVTSPAAQNANIVRQIRGQEMVQNFPVPLSPGKPAAFGPKTQFIRLYGVTTATKAGDRFPITLHFQHTPDATIDVMVQAR